MNGTNDTNDTNVTNGAARMQRVTLAIDGLSYEQAGSATVERALRALPGVAHVYVNPSIEMAYVEYDPLLCCPAGILGAVQSSGYRGGELCVR